jgi:hypothetical protein
MLNRDQQKRITKSQTAKIKNHPWCRDVNWTKVLNKELKPPFEPSIFSSNFDPEYVRDSSIAT